MSTATSHLRFVGSGKKNWLKVCAVNITKWRLSIPRGLMSFDVLAFCETHEVSDGHIIRDLRNSGFRLVSHNRAVFTSAFGSSGGVMIAVRTKFRCVPFIPPLGLFPPSAQGRVECALLRLRKVTVLTVAVYLYVGEGLSERNVAILQAIEILSGLTKNQFIVLGDFNLSRNELSTVSWPPLV